MIEIFTSNLLIASLLLAIVSINSSMSFDDKVSI